MRVSIRKMVFFTCGLLLGLPASSQTLSWFSYENYARPLIAEMYAPMMKMELTRMNSLHPYYYKTNATDRPFIESQAGFQIPLLSIEKAFSNGNLMATVFSPNCIVTLVDMFEEETAPIINNDYRFGLQAMLLYAPLKTWKLLQNYYLSVVPMFHESTHLGDEFSLHGYEQIPDFARINVSYEAWQVYAGINRPLEKRENNLNLEIGYQRLMPYKEGYYNIDPYEVKGADIILSDARDLWLFRGEYTHPLIFREKSPGSLVASTELRREIKFGYFADDPEKDTWSFNAYLGFQMPVKNTKRYIGMYFRHYRGIVPYGQLRDKDGFILNGISLVIN